MKVYKDLKVEMILLDEDPIKTSISGVGESEQGVDCGAKWFS